MIFRIILFPNEFYGLWSVSIVFSNTRAINYFVFRNEFNDNLVGFFFKSFPRKLLPSYSNIPREIPSASSVHFTVISFQLSYETPIFILRLPKNLLPIAIRLQSLLKKKRTKIDSTLVESKRKIVETLVNYSSWTEKNRI